VTTAFASKSLLSIPCEHPGSAWSHAHHLLLRSVPAISNSARSFAAHRYCGSGQDLTVDHVKPVSKGGLWDWSNLVTACNKCNGKKGSKTLKQLGWKLKKIPSVSKLVHAIYSIPDNVFGFSAHCLSLHKVMAALCRRHQHGRWECWWAWSEMSTTHPRYWYGMNARS